MNSMCSRVSLTGLGLLAIVAIVGCDTVSYDGPARARVYGTVTYQGEPVDYGMIYFDPPGNAGETARRASGHIIDGKYDIPEEKGPNHANYVVQIRWEKVKEGAKPTSEEEDVVRENVLPAKYNTSSELSLTIDGRSVEKNWELD